MYTDNYFNRFALAPEVAEALKKCKCIAYAETKEELQELACHLLETQLQTVLKALSLVAQNNRQALSQIQEELEKEQASRETFQQQVGKEQERFTSKLSEEYSARKNELEAIQQQTARRWRQLRRRLTLGLLLSWALACGALWMLLR